MPLPAPRPTEAFRTPPMQGARGATAIITTRSHPKVSALARHESAPKIVIPGGNLFREEAIEAYLRGDAGAAVLRVAPPWTRTLFRIAAIVTVAAIALACIGKVDLTARAPGILRAEGGTQTLTAQASGRIQDVRVASGDAVQTGDPLVTFDIAAAKALVMEADQQLAIAQANVRAYEERQVAHRDEEKRLVAARLRLLGERTRSQVATRKRLEHRRARLVRLQAEGLATANELDDVDEQIAAAGRATSAIGEEVTQGKTQLSQLSSGFEAEIQRLRSAVDAARAHQEAVAFSLAQTSVVAPKAGKIEAVVVQRGDSVVAGQPIAKIVPADAPLRVVSFLNERDRAFVEVGAVVRLELEQLPATEFGALNGRVTRVARELASTYELREILGDKADAAGPVYRVDVELVDDAQARTLARYLRPSSLVAVRFALRTRRIITLLIEPLRKILS